MRPTRARCKLSGVPNRLSQAELLFLTSERALNLRDNDRMVKAVEGVYRNGRVDLVEPLDEAEGSRVIVTWVGSPRPVDLREKGIDESQAADLLRRLSSFAEDWDRPEMDVYDELPPR